MASTIYNVIATGSMGALPRTDWLVVDSGATGGTDGKIAILHQACSALSAGNPTPDTATFPPADYPPGSLFLPTSYPAAQDNGTGLVTTYHAGDMVFRRTGGAGAETWTWFGGSFRASNSNGNYQRFADGSQKCDIWDFVTGDGAAITYTDSKTLPATFATVTSAANGALGSKTTADPTSITDFPASAGSINTGLQAGPSSVTATLRTTNDVALASGTRVGWSAHLEGTW
jgi:hypothetical protein